MHFLIIILFLCSIILGPSWWVRRVLQHYSATIKDLPGTGAELAQHLVERFRLEGVEVTQTELGDHYDPSSKTVALSDQVFGGKSLTAIAVAVHEVGHAIQHQQQERLFLLRGKLTALTHRLEKLGVISMFLMPIVGGVTRVPHLSGFLLLFGLSSLFVSFLVHMITLPVEIDASFNKALPIIEQGEYVPPEDLPAVRKILRAAALTYAAGALASLLNIWRWIAILRR